MVADAWFAKQNFIHPVMEAGFEVISRFRADADMKYLYQGPQKGRGRPKKFDGKVNPTQLNMDHFQAVDNSEGDTLHTAVVFGFPTDEYMPLILPGGGVKEGGGQQNATLGRVQTILSPRL